VLSIQTEWFIDRGNAAYAIPIIQPERLRGRPAHSFRSVSYKAVCFLRSCVYNAHRENKREDSNEIRLGHTLRELCYHRVGSKRDFKRARW
jgi:hypothetical protein